jgi:hypothetical protein
MSPGDLSACDATNVDLDWVYDNAADFATVSWTFINSSLASNTIMQHSLGEASPVVVDNFNVVYKINGGITLTNVDEKNSGSYKISVTYLSGSPVDDTVSVSVKGNLFFFSSMFSLNKTIVAIATTMNAFLLLPTNFNIVHLFFFSSPVLFLYPCNGSLLRHL